MREIRTSGSTRGSNGMGNPRPLLSTLLSIRGFRMRHRFNIVWYRGGHATRIRSRFHRSDLAPVPGMKSLAWEA